MVTEKLPFVQYFEGDYCVREFEIDVQHRDLKWHYDEEPRRVKVIKSNGWKFQYDNQLPIDLIEGDIINIEPYNYHRCIKGHDKLIIKFLVSASDNKQKLNRKSTEI